MKNSIIKDASMLSVTNSVTLIISMINSKVLTEVYSRTDFGLQSQVLLTTTIVMSFFSLGLPSAPNYFLPKTRELKEKQDFLSQLYTLFNLIGIGLSITIALLSPFIVKYFKNPELNKCVIVFIILPWIRMLGSSFNNIMIAEGRTRYAVYVTLFRTAFSVGVISIVWLEKISIVELIYLNFFIDIFFSLLMIFISIRAVKKIPFFKWNNELIKKILVFSLPLAAATMVGTLSIQIDKLFVSYYLNTSDLALYSVASKELPVNFISSAFIAVIMPKIVDLVHRKEFEHVLELWGHVVEFSYIIVGFAVAALVVFSRDVILLLYSTKYLEGQAIFIVFSLGLIGRITYFGMVLNAKGRTKLILYCAIADLIENFIMNFILFRFFGMLGLAIATFISTYTMNIYQLWITSKELNTTFKKIFPWDRLLKITIINLVSGVIIYYIYNIMHIKTSSNSILFAILIGIAWMLIYGLIVFRRSKTLISYMHEY